VCSQRLRGKNDVNDERGDAMLPIAVVSNLASASLSVSNPKNLANVSYQTVTPFNNSIRVSGVGLLANATTMLQDGLLVKLLYFPTQ
jgi:hypothetical protein